MTKTLGIEKVLWIKIGEGIVASGVIPTEAEFFKDHFPGFPVLPGVLALEMFRMSADIYLRHAGFDKHHFRIKKIRGVKFSHYLKPGDSWESRLDLVSKTETEFVWNAKMIHAGEVAVSARLTVVVERTPAGLMFATV